MTICVTVSPEICLLGLGIASRLEAMTKRKNPHAVALSKLGAKKGGQARAAKLTPEERKAIARKGAAARWGKGS